MGLDLMAWGSAWAVLPVGWQYVAGGVLDTILDLQWTLRPPFKRSLPAWRGPLRLNGGRFGFGCGDSRCSPCGYPGQVIDDKSHIEISIH